MQHAIRIYECRCGQYSPVDTSAQLPVCSRCGSPRFKRMLWLQNDKLRGGALWMRADYRPEQQPEKGLNGSPPAAEPVQADVVDDEEARFDVGMARALLKYLEMLKRGGAICEQHYETETQRVLKRVIHELRELQAQGDN